MTRSSFSSEEGASTANPQGIQLYTHAVTVCFFCLRWSLGPAVQGLMTCSPFNQATILRGHCSQHDQAVSESTRPSSRLTLLGLPCSEVHEYVRVMRCSENTRIRIIEQPGATTEDQLCLHGGSFRSRWRSVTVESRPMF